MAGRQIKITHDLAYIEYRKVVSNILSPLVAHFQVFTRLMKGKFDSYVL
jgi:hypothetical protein